MLRFLVKLMMALLMSFSLVFTPIQTAGDPTAEPPAIETIEPTEEEKEQETIPSETVPTETKPVVIEPTPTEPEPTEPPHEHSYTSSILSATCTEAGYTTYTCQCGDSYTDNHEGALGHNYKSTVIEATKQNGGYTQHTCSRCEDTYTDSYTDKLPTVYVNLANYNSIKHNYNEMNANDMFVINDIMEHYEKYTRGEEEHPYKTNYLETEELFDSEQKVEAFFMLDFANWDDTQLIFACAVVNRSGEPTEYILTYRADNFPEMMEKKAKMDVEIDRILSGFEEGTEEELLRQCADWLRDNMEYDGSSNNGCDAIFTKRANCNSFAQLFMKMANRLGIQCDWCEGYAKGTLHAWNRVTFSDGSVRYYDISFYNSNGSAKYLCMDGSPWPISTVNEIYKSY